MIRAAHVRDVPEMVGLARAFHEWARPPWEWSPATVERTCAECVVRDDLCAFVADRGGAIVGGLIGALVTSPLHGGLEAHELGAFVRQNSRGCGVSLFRRLRAWGRERGAVLTVVQDWAGEAGPLYERMGFRPVSGVWVG